MIRRPASHNKAQRSAYLPVEGAAGAAGAGCCLSGWATPQRRIFFASTQEGRPSQTNRVHLISSSSHPETCEDHIIQPTRADPIRGQASDDDPKCRITPTCAHRINNARNIAHPSKPADSTEIPPDAMAPAATPIQPRSPAPADNTPTIPAYYGSLHSGPDPGTVAGIVLGSVAGFILLLWLIYTCINMGNPSLATNDTSTVVTEGTASVYVQRRHRSRSHQRESRRLSRRGVGVVKETVELRRGGPVVVEEMVSSVGPDRVVVEETRRRRSVSAARPPPRRVAVESDYTATTGDEDDEVIVIEEHGRGGRQRSRVRSVERRSSGFREVDPDRYGGGDSSFVEVRRSGSHHRR